VRPSNTADVDSVGLAALPREDDPGEVIEFYASREQAEAALKDVLTDEPQWEGLYGVVPVEFPFSPQ
jgi:hypothetical protein